MIIILLIVLVLFGAKRLPELAKGMGQAMKEFQKAKDDFSHELHPVATTGRSMEGESVVSARPERVPVEPAAALSRPSAD